MKKALSIAIVVLRVDFSLPALAVGKNWKNELKAGLETAYTNTVLTIAADGLEGNTGKIIKHNEVYEGQVVQLLGTGETLDFLIGKILPLPRGAKVNIKDIAIKSNDALSLKLLTVEPIRGEQLRAEITFTIKYLNSATTDEVKKIIEAILAPATPKAQAR